MSNLVQLTNNNGIAVITINNPPVNALSPGVPEGILEAIDTIEKDESQDSPSPLLEMLREHITHLSSMNPPRRCT